VTLGTTLLAARRRDIVADYHHPGSLLAVGYLSVLVAAVAGLYSLQGIAALWR
jgi:hypothetical protein